MHENGSEPQKTGDDRAKPDAMGRRNQSPHPVTPLIPPVVPRALVRPSVNPSHPPYPDKRPDPQTKRDFRNRHLGRKASSVKLHGNPNRLIVLLVRHNSGNSIP